MTNASELLDPDRIYLEPGCCFSPYEGRQWCENNVWPLDGDCEATGVEYVRADQVTQLEAQLAEMREAAVRFLDACNSAWSCGEPSHRVKTMLDRADELRALLTKEPK